VSSTSSACTTGVPPYASPVSKHSFVFRHSGVRFSVRVRAVRSSSATRSQVCEIFARFASCLTRRSIAHVNVNVVCVVQPKMRDRI
jgi:hypothetical protein